MAIAYVGNNSATATGATEVDLSIPAGAAAGDLIIGVYAFEGVAAGSGPWSVPNIGQLATDYIGPSTGWQQVCWQAPSAAGVGIEVWSAILFSGSLQWLKFAAPQNAVGVCVAYSGIAGSTNPVVPGTVRLATTAQVSGNQPAAPSVTANAGELVVACGGDLMGGGGFGAPSGFTSRIDAARSGAGTVEAVIADATISTAGATGLITFPNAAATGTTKGTTATLAIRPAPTTGGSGGLLEAPMPGDLDIQDGYTIRATALDPTTGAVVSGVNITSMIITATPLIAGDPSALSFGPWALVPGPGA